MNTEQREEIESCISAIELGSVIERSGEDVGISCDELIPLAQFARQQLNLRVDGQKLMERIINANLVRPQCAMDENHPIINVWEANAEEQLEALVLECITTTPEEKE